MSHDPSASCTDQAPTTAQQTGRLAYTIGHGVKEGLVQRVPEWPGLSCVSLLLTEAGMCFDWVNRTEQGEAARKSHPAADHAFTQRVSLRLVVLPCWEGLTAKQRCREVERIINEIEERALAERGDRPVLGADRVRARIPTRCRRR
jgi:hypothetical protein